VRARRASQGHRSRDRVARSPSSPRRQKSWRDGIERDAPGAISVKPRSDSRIRVPPEIPNVTPGLPNLCPTSTTPPKEIPTLCPPIRSWWMWIDPSSATNRVWVSAFEFVHDDSGGAAIPMLTQFFPLLLCGALLSGCGSVLTATTSDVAGIAGAGVASAVTKSPTAAAGIGLGIAAGANAGLQYVERDVHEAEQDRIAAAAGGLEPGVVGHWRVSHTIPIEDNEHGDLVVTRLIGSADFSCKEIVFSVDTVERKVPRRAFYTATVCQDGPVWKWASAEPATARWGSLQ
jgi:hypothetical protein